MRKLSLLVLAVAPLAACAPRVVQVGTGAASVPAAEAVMRDAQGRVLGTLTLSQRTEGVLVTGSLTGVPAGVHGIHVHAVGQCAPTFAAAGGHWNPAGRQHGSRNPNGAHAGDLPNVTAANDGTLLVNATVSGAKVAEGSVPMLDADGAALVLHAKADDYLTDPSGNSGDRIACGVITRR